MRVIGLWEELQTHKMKGVQYGLTVLKASEMFKWTTLELLTAESNKFSFRSLINTEPPKQYYNTVSWHLEGKTKENIHDTIE